MGPKIYFYDFSCLGSLSHPELQLDRSYPDSKLPTLISYNLNDLDLICQIGEAIFPFPYLYLVHRSWSWLNKKLNTDVNTSLNHLLKWLTRKKWDPLDRPGVSWLNREWEWKPLSPISFHFASVEDWSIVNPGFYKFNVLIFFNNIKWVKFLSQK